MKKCEGIFYRINDLRLLYRKNKLFFIVASICLLIGLALAIRFCCLQTEKKEALSLAGYIAAGEYPFGKIFVFIILLPILLCASILLLSFNYYSIFAFYLELIIASYIVFKNNLFPISCSFLPGICTFCLFIMPIMLVNAFFITILWTGSLFGRRFSMWKKDFLHTSVPLSYQNHQIIVLQMRRVHPLF